MTKPITPERVQELVEFDEQVENTPPHEPCPNQAPRHEWVQLAVALSAECQRITERLRTLVHGTDDVTADTAIDSLAVTVQRRRDLAAELLVILNREQEWRIKAESDRDRLAAGVQRLTDEATDWILVADGVKHDWRCSHGEADTPMCLRCQVERLTEGQVAFKAYQQDRRITQLVEERDRARVLTNEAHDRMDCGGCFLMDGEEQLCAIAEEIASWPTT